ncbi:MAG: aminoacetone oxidase family FAD-binding enzyme [Elusimicrobiota bacterium]
MSEIYDAAVIGAGASGLAFSCLACEKGIKVALIEKNHKIGRKLLSTGAGKCNITNKKISVSDYICGDEEKLKSIFKKTPHEEVVKFIEEFLGIILTEKEEGRLYPYSMRAETAVFAFERLLKKFNTNIFLLKKAVSIKKINGIFEILCEDQDFPGSFKKTKKDISAIKAKNIILACGGPSYPRIGATEEGFSLVKSFGHSVLPLNPILTSFSVKYPNLSSLDGVRVRGKILSDKAEYSGEILFTSYGISGDAGIDFSFDYIKNKTDSLILDLMPDKTVKEISERFSKIKGHISDVLSCSLDKKLAAFILRNAQISLCSENNRKVSIKAAEHIKNLKISGISPMGFDYAMSKTGGVPLNEITENFNSLKEKKLYITGELLDCGGRSGGYNLHFAFTSAIAAAKHILTV